MNGLVNRERGFKIWYLASFWRHLWASHINDSKRNSKYYAQLHTQSNAWKDVALESEGEPIGILRKPTILNDEAAGQFTIQKNSIERHEDLPTGREANWKPIDPMAFEKIGEEDLSSHFPVDKSFNRIDKRTAGEIEMDDKWKKNWLEAKAFKHSKQKERLRKGRSSYDVDTPLKLVWKEKTPASSLALRGRLFRQRLVGKRPGLNIPRVEEPSSWTKIEFDKYVWQLARVNPLPAPVAQALNRGEVMRVEARSTRERGAVLHELMHRRLSHAFIEPEICNVAIHFLTRHQMIAKARSILSLMEHLNLAVGPSTFNLFLKAAVHQHDLATFTYILKLMVARGVRRDSQTIMLLVSCLPSRAQKTEVIRRLELAGTRLKNRLMRRDLIAGTVKQDIAAFLEAGGEPLDFIGSMRRTHKVGWMSTRIGNIIFDEVCKRVHVDAALDILPHLVDEGFQPDIVTLRSPLCIEIDQRRPDKAADLLDHFSSKYNIHPDADIYRKIWYMAWNRHSLNVSAVVFVAACINGALTSEMRNMVLLSIKLNNDLLRSKSSAVYGPSKSDSSKPDSTTPGFTNPVITTPDITTPDFTPPVSLDPSDFANPPLRRRLPIKLPGRSSCVYLSLMGNFVLNLDPWAHSESYGSLHGYILQMIRTWATGRFQLRYSFGYHLRAAARLDFEWKIFQGNDVKEKLRNPYMITLELKREAQVGRGRRKVEEEGGVVTHFVHSTVWKAPPVVDSSYFGRPLHL